MRRRPINAFSLSFLDCICCGFGAVILIFILIIHRVSETAEAVTADAQAEAERLQLRVDVLGDAVQEAATALRDAEAEGDRLDAEVASIGARLEMLAAVPTPQPDPTPGAPDPPSQRIGRTREIQLLGLRVDGQRSLILVDSSASMLDPTIVGIIRQRHLPDAVKRRAGKWRQAVAAVDWLTEHLPPEGLFQIYRFAGDATSLIAGTEGRWLEAADSALLARARRELRQVVPQGGTSLDAAVRAIASMRPRPDHVYLLVDGLPTLGRRPTRATTVTGKERLKHFAAAVRELPRGVTVNVLLYPMEGDPGAASAYWDLAIASGGALLSPAGDWP